MDAKMQELLDRAGVREAIERYFVTIDRHDWDGLGDVFTADARAEMFDGKLVLEGRPAIIRAMSKMEAFASTCHQAGNIAFEIDGDVAETDIFAVAYCVEKPIGASRVMVRGVQYRDRIVRDGDRWRIAFRRHIPLWQYDAPSQAPADFGGVLKKKA